MLHDCKTVGDFTKTRPDICGFHEKIPIVCCPFGSIGNKTFINSRATQKASSSSIIFELPSSPSTPTTPSTEPKPNWIPLEVKKINVTKSTEKKNNQPGAKAVQSNNLFKCDLNELVARY